MSDRASELKDLDVDRVDGVDRPATGRNFLLFKSEGGADSAAIMKDLGAVSTAASIALAKMRTDASCQVQRSTAIALNGLAQMLGQEPVFVDKSVPTQPYEIKEDVDVDSRGPADEKLGSNFVARSIGSVTFKMKEYDDEDSKVAGKAKQAAAKAKAKEKEADPEPDADDEMDGSEAANRGVARKKSAEDFDAAIAKGVMKALVDMGLAAPVQKSADQEKYEAERSGWLQPQRKAAPVSKQVQADDEREPVRKSGGRMGVSFADIAFNRQ